MPQVDLGSVRAVLVGSVSIDLTQRSGPARDDHFAMSEHDKQSEVKEPKPSRLDEARRVIEEYAADLRELIQKLRRKMN